MPRILIYETCQERANGLYRQVQWFYDSAANAVDQVISSGVEYCQQYSYATTNPVYSYCEGTTKKTVYHNGGGAIRTEDTLNSPDCGYNPPGGNPIPVGCDLVITEVQTGASRKGQNNGFVNIMITVSSGNIEYSTDGVNFSSGSLKTNLAPGNYIAYARKAEEVACIASAAFTIEELPGISVTASSGCNGGLGFINLTVTPPTNEALTIDLINQTTQEIIHEEIPDTASYDKTYVNLTNGIWRARVKGSKNTIETYSDPIDLNCAPGTGNGTGGLRITEMEFMTELHDNTLFTVVDLNETDPSKQNKKIWRNKVSSGVNNGGGSTTIVTGGLQKKTVDYVTGTTTYVLPFPVTADNLESADVLGPQGISWDLGPYTFNEAKTEITYTDPPAVGNGTLRFWYNSTPDLEENPNPGTQYQLPIASAESLGGFKVGEDFSINSTTGVLTFNRVVQGTGTSTKAVMSQKAVTDLFNSLSGGGGGGGTMTAEEIRDALQTLLEDNRLDASAIKHLPTGLVKEFPATGDQVVAGQLYFGGGLLAMATESYLSQYGTLLNDFSTQRERFEMIKRFVHATSELYNTRTSFGTEAENPPTVLTPDVRQDITRTVGEGYHYVRISGGTQGNYDDLKEDQSINLVIPPNRKVRILYDTDTLVGFFPEIAETATYHRAYRFDFPGGYWSNVPSFQRLLVVSGSDIGAVPEPDNNTPVIEYNDWAKEFNGYGQIALYPQGKDSQWGTQMIEIGMNGGIIRNPAQTNNLTAAINAFANIGAQMRANPVSGNNAATSTDFRTWLYVDLDEGNGNAAYAGIQAVVKRIEEDAPSPPLYYAGRGSLVLRAMRRSDGAETETIFEVRPDGLFLNGAALETGGGGPAYELPAAKTNEMGGVFLSVPPAVPTIPVVVGSNDGRLLSKETATFGTLAWAATITITVPDVIITHKWKVIIAAGAAASATLAVAGDSNGVFISGSIYNNDTVSKTITLPAGDLSPGGTITLGAGKMLDISCKNDGTKRIWQYTQL